MIKYITIKNTIIVFLVFILLACIARPVNNKPAPVIISTITQTMQPIKPTDTVQPTHILQPSYTVVPSATPTIEPTVTDQPTSTITPEPTLTETSVPTKIVVVKPVVPVKPRTVTKPTATANGLTIICKDGYVWPSTVRRGACHGHNGIRK